jgi:hypothetical protein
MPCSVVRNQQHTQTHRLHSNEGIHSHGRVGWWWLTSQITTQNTRWHTHSILLLLVLLSLSLPFLYTQTPSRHQPSLFSPSSRYNPPSSLPILIYTLLRRLQSDTRCIVSFFIPTSFLSFLCQSTTTRSFPPLSSIHSTLSFPSTDIISPLKVATLPLRLL